MRKLFLLLLTLTTLLAHAQDGKPRSIKEATARLEALSDIINTIDVQALGGFGQLLANNTTSTDNLLVYGGKVRADYRVNKYFLAGASLSAVRRDFSDPFWGNITDTYITPMAFAGLSIPIHSQRDMQTAFISVGPMVGYSYLGQDRSQDAASLKFPNGSYQRGGTYSGSGIVGGVFLAGQASISERTTLILELSAQGGKDKNDYTLSYSAAMIGFGLAIP